jgi:hypothetical protein
MHRECIALNVENFHLGFLDSDVLVVDPLVKRALNLEAGFRRRSTDHLDDRHPARQGWPRQLCVMWQNMRCSMRFHLDVSGGSWFTRSVSLTRAPLEPPQSAVIRHQGRVAFAERLRASALAAHTALRQQPFLKIGLAPVDSGASEPRDPAYHDERPAARTSLAANKRFPRSSSLQPSNSQRSLMLSRLIMPKARTPVRATQKYARVDSPHAHRSRFTYRCRCP